MTPDAVAAAVAGERTAMVASLIRLTGDWDLAEDCVQDAVARALVHWPRDGIPRSPAAWLTTVARNRALDVLRRRRTERAKLQERAILDEMGADPDPASGGGRRAGRVRRPAAADLHLLPPGAAARRAGGADAQGRGRAEHGGDRPGVPRVGARHGAAAAAHQAQDRPRRHPVPGAAARAARRAHERRAGRPLPHLQRGLRPARRAAGRRGAAPRPDARRPHARRRRGPRAAGAGHAADVPAGGPLRRRRRARADGGAGPQPLGRRARRRGAAPPAARRPARAAPRGRSGSRRRSPPATPRPRRPAPRTGPRS